jgi:hypothetical protein
MPVVPFEKLPDDSRVWVFAADRTLNEQQSQQMLAEVDRFLPSWTAHGSPLTVGRDWRYGRFLTIGVDRSTVGASGCSIDGLFRSLKSLEGKLGASMVTSGLVFFRDQSGAVQSADRWRFTQLGGEGKVSTEMTAFDPTVTTLGEWRARFELPLRDSWHAKLLTQKQPA